MSISEQDVEQALAAVMRGAGRPGGGLSVSQIRELGPGDLPKLLCPPESQPATVKTIRAAHHHLARALAKGASIIEASAITGYTPARIQQLRKAPAFIELEAYYAEQVEAAGAEVLERIKVLSISAVEELQDRLETAPENFRNDDLTKLATAMLDRTGHGPTTKVESTSVVLDAAALFQLKQRAASRAKGTVIDAQSYRPITRGVVDGDAAERGLGEYEEEGQRQPPQGAQL